MNIFVLKIAVCLVLFSFFVVFRKKAKNVLYLLRDLYSSRRLIWSLSKNDFKTKYAGSYLGILWAFVQPVITVLVFWLVFQYGLKASSPIEGTPFVVWFVAGIVPWFFFSDAWNNATNSFIEYSYLVKKVQFKISILPIVKIISSFFVHAIFLLFLFVLLVMYDKSPGIIMIQIIYYIACNFFIVLGISFLTSSIVVFFKDIGQIMSIVLQVGMWVTPIMWSYVIVPERYLWIIKLNPIFYVIEGYRDTFINGVWFWQRYFQTTYFWLFSCGILVLGAIVFKKLRPHFADVL